MRQKLFINILFLISYLAVGFLPNFKAIDKIGPQYLYLSILNIFVLIYLIYDIGVKDFYNLLFKRNYVIFSFTSFFIWGTLSFFYALNTSEVLIESSRIFIYLQAFSNLFIITQRSKFDLKYIPIIFSTILIIESLWVFIDYINLFVLSQNSTSTRSIQLRAFTGNINITAFAMLIKIPFLCFYLIDSKKLNYLIKITILTFVFFTIFLIGSRGANLTLLLISIFISVAGLKLNLKRKGISFVIITALLLSIFINNLVFQENTSLNYVERTSNILDTSSQKRIRFYKHALESIFQNPLQGIGLGNWKIQSIQSDNAEILEYEIPYHVHNDFLEIFTELGIIGFVLFFGIYLYLIVLFYKSFKEKSITEKDKIFSIFFFAMIIIYLSDSLLNFPFTRPVMQIPNLFAIAALVYISRNNQLILFPKLRFKLPKKTTIIFLSINILLLLGSVFVSFKIYQSFTIQSKLIMTASGINKDYDLNYVKNIDTDFPNITVHTMPMSALKATLLLNLGEKDSVLNLLNDASKENPYLGYNEIVKSIYYLENQQIDSSYKYARLAYNKLPNQFNHFNHYLNLIEFKKDTLALNQILDDLNLIFNEKKYQKYIQVSTRLKNKISLSEQDLIDKLTLNNPTSGINNVLNIIGEVGLDNVAKGYLYQRSAIEAYEKKDYEKSAELFLKASQYNPKEISYIENAANCFNKLRKFNKSITMLEKLIVDSNPKSGKAEYLLAIAYISLENSEIGCKFLKDSKSKGFKFNPRMLTQFCK